MNIPALPTDNLYKFITVLGAALVVFSVWLRSDINDKISMSLSETERLIRSIDVEGDDIKFRQDQIKKKGDDLIKSDPKVDDAENFKRQAEQFKAEVKDFEVAVKNQALRSAEAKSNHERTGIMIDREQKLTPTIDFMSKYGWTMFIGGLIFWYWNHQRHQDRLIRLEANLKARPEQLPREHS